MYTYDTFLILDGTEKLLTESFHILDTFYKCS